jgi:hypothetical protein
MGYGNVTFTMATPFGGWFSRLLLAPVMALARSQRDYGPLRRITALHFAGFAVVRPKWSRPYLLFFSQFDGAASAYLADFSMLVPDQIDAIWGKCLRYPGARRAEQFVHWLEQHALTDEDGKETQYDYHGYRVDAESAACVTDDPAPDSDPLRPATEGANDGVRSQQAAPIADRLPPMPLIESSIELMFRLDALRAVHREGGDEQRRRVTENDIFDLAGELL